MLKEELQRLQEPGSYVGEVVKVCSRNIRSLRRVCDSTLPRMLAQHLATSHLVLATPANCYEEYIIIWLRGDALVCGQRVLQKTV
jgi:hypothetical protein